MRAHNKRAGLVLGVSALAMAAVLTLAHPAQAADATSTLQGHVAGAAAGSKVTVVDANTGQRVEVTVGSDGQYIIVGLRPSTYHVTAGADRQDVTLAVGETTTLDLNASAAPTTVTVVATRRAPVRTAEVATSVSQTQIDRLPQLDRNFMNFAALAPGVSVSTDPNNKTFKGGGTPASQVNVFIDGQSQKNQVLQGGTAGQDSSRGNPFPQSAVQEFKVSTQNFSAEYEQAGTSIITAVTKTGGNEFHGSVFDEIETKAMSGWKYFDRAGHANNPTGAKMKPDFHRSQYGLELGGPIIKDKLHFYFSYEGDDEVHPSVAVNMPNSAQNNYLSTLPALNTYLQGLNGSYADPYNEKLFFGKLTYTPNDADTIDFSIFNRFETNQQAFGGSTAFSAGSNADNFLRSALVSWKHRGDQWLNEADLETQSYHWRQSNTSSMPSVSLLDDKTNPNCLTCAWAKIGGPEYTQVKAQDDVTFKDTFTYTGFDWHGHHVVKAGVKYAAYKYDAAENMYQYFYDDRYYSVGGTGNAPKAALVNSGNPTIKTNNNQWGLFVQDSWTVNEHLQADYGIRWDYESNMLNDKYVTPAPVAAAIRGFTNFKNAGFNPEDYISDGHNRKPITNMFAPRFGLSYDVNGDHKWVIFGGAGRYYDRTINDDVQLEPRRAYAPQVTLQFCGVPASGLPACGAAGTGGKDINGRYPWDPKYLTAAGVGGLATGATGEIYALKNDTKVPYNDQFDIGIRHQFEGGITASVTASEIKGHNLFTWMLGNRNPDGSWCASGPQYSCQPWAYGLPGYGNFLISTDDGASDYQALYFQVDKPYTRASHYGYSGALTLTNAKNNGNQTEFAFDYADQRDTGMHPSPVDKVRFVGTGIVDMPYGFQLSGILTLASGVPFDLIDNRGPALRIIPTSVYPKNKMAYQDLDLRLSKDFALPNGQVVTLDAQVYNVFDSVNRTYSGWGGGFADPTHGPSGQGDNDTTGYARTFQVGLKYRF
jgi:hypothetical protein